MQVIDKGTVIDCYGSADELYEVARFISGTQAIEVVQVRHDDLIQYLVIEHTQEITDFLDQAKFGDETIIRATVFQHAIDARLALIEHVMQAQIRIESY